MATTTPNPPRPPDQRPRPLQIDPAADRAAWTAVSVHRRRRRRFRVLARVVLGCVVVIAAAAAVSALLVRHQVDNLRNALSEHASIKIAPGTLAPGGWGDPQTLLLVGNDQRAHTTTTPVLPHSNEMLLVRIDPNKPWISMMSIPRELYVPIQTPNGPVTTRLNAALLYGGIPLLVQTIKQVTGLAVNHVVVVDFNQFKQAVDDLGCVYSTVDRRYFHVNTPYSQQYQEIDLQPGYQRMCGVQALQFVSYRHGDTSLVRDARDQHFLLDARKQFSPQLIGNIGKFERIFGATVTTDPALHTDTGILDLLGTVISSAGEPVRQVQFQVNLLPTYDTATPEQIAASVHSFLYGANHVSKQGTAAAARAVHSRGGAARLPLAPVDSTELTAARDAVAKLPFPLEFPRVSDSRAGPGPVDLRSCPQDAIEVTCMRTYLIHGPGGRPYPAYVIAQYAGVLGQYYDIQGTNWAGAPQFANPDQIVTVAGRSYHLYYAGAHLNMVAWAEHGAVYWIHNTLLDSVGNGELLAIAEQTRPLTGATAAVGVAVTRASLRAVTLPARTPPTVTSTRETIGSLLGLLALLSLPLLSLPLWWRRREHGRLRAELEQLTARAAGLRETADRAGRVRAQSGRER